MNTRIFKPLLLPLLIGLASLTAAQAQTAAQPARSTGTAAKSMNSNTLDELLGERRADKVPTGPVHTPNSSRLTPTSAQALPTAAVVWISRATLRLKSKT